MLRKQCFVCKIFHGVVEGFCKGLNKGTTAGRACFVQLHAVYRTVFDLDTFPILTADIQNAVDIRREEGCCVIMCHSFHFAFIQQKSRFHQCFTIACGAGMLDHSPFRKLGINILDRGDRCLQRVTVVRAVERI